MEVSIGFCRTFSLLILATLPFVFFLKYFLVFLQGINMRTELSHTGRHHCRRTGEPVISSIRDLTVKAAVLKTSKETHIMVNNLQCKVVEGAMVVLTIREVTTKDHHDLHHLHIREVTTKGRDLRCLHIREVIIKSDLGTIAKDHKEGLGISVRRGMETIVLHLELEIPILDMVRDILVLDKS